MADIGDTVRGVVRYVTPGASEQLNIFYWTITEVAIGNPALLDLIEEWVELTWAPAWQPIASGDSEIFDVAVDTLNLDGTVKQNIGSALINIDGSGPAAVTSAAVSGYLLAPTNEPRSRGSKYVPGIDEVAIVQGLFSSAALADLAVLAALYITNIVAPVGSVLLPGVLSIGVQLFREFLDEASTTDVPAYQRRRKPGVGS